MSLKQISQGTEVLSDKSNDDNKQGTEIGTLLDNAQVVGGADQKIIRPIITVTPTDIKQFLRTPTLITTLSVSNADVVGTTRTVTSDVTILPFAYGAMQNFLRGYRGYRGDIELVIQMTPPSQSYGLYMLVVFPTVNNGITAQAASSNRSVYGTETCTWKGCMQFPHVFLDLSKGNVAKLVLPWSATGEEFIPTNAYSGSHWLRNFTYQASLVCLSPAKSISSTSVFTNISCYFNLADNVELLIPTYQSNPGHTIRAMQKAVSFGADRVGDVLDALGYTREADLTPSMAVAPNFGNVGVCDGVDKSLSVGLMSSASTTIDQTFGGITEVDECTCKEIYAKWINIANFTFADSTAAGSNLWSIPVTPYVYSPSLSSSTLFTAAGYVGIPFMSWRGGMEYLIKIPSSPFHRGILQCVWVPEDRTISTYGDWSGTLKTVNIDVTAGVDYIIKIGYAHPMPVLRSVWCNQLGVPTYVPDQFQFPDWQNGTLYINCLQPLSGGANGVSTVVDVLVFARAAEDMKFGNPTSTGPLRLTTPSTWTVGLQRALTHIQYQSNFGEDVKDRIEEIVLSPIIPSTVPKDVMWGEEFDSIRALVQRPSVSNVFTGVSGTLVVCGPMMPVPYTVNGQPNSGTVHLVTNGTPSDVVNAVWTWMTHYALLFNGWRGSVRKKYINATPAVVTTLRATYRDAPTAATISSNFPSSIVAAAASPNGSIAEFVYPNNGTDLFFRNTHYFPLVSSVSTAQIVDDLTVSTIYASTAGTCFELTSFGPDIVLTVFAGVPSIILP